MAPTPAMVHVRAVRAGIVVALAVLLTPLCVMTGEGARAEPGPSPKELPGWGLYDRFCLACHGARGDGAGPAAAWIDPSPRDFTARIFKWTSTGDPGAPARRDLAQAIGWGAPGTAMHGYGGSLTADQIDAIVEVVRRLAGLRGDPRARDWELPRVGSAARPARIQRGAEVWARLGCAMCHGPAGAGDGPAAAGLKPAGRAPYDLTAGPVRRPRGGDSIAQIEAAIARSIAWGVGGTAMPGYENAASVAEIDAVAAYVATLGPATADGMPPVSAAAIARSGGGGSAGYDEGLFDRPIAVQRDLPAALGPAQASLSSRQCGRCHAKQRGEWGGSVHAAAGSPGLLAQYGGLSAAEIESCQGCHAPLAEQHAAVRPAQEGSVGANHYRANPWFDAGLRGEGVTCAACHVRGGVRHGPPGSAPSLLPLPGYPRRELPVYERGDFCIGCHQLPAALAVAGRPLLDTYREWLLGPYMKRGVQCQHCHMPNREHTWKGVHDPETFRQGIAVAVTAERGATGVVSVRARVENVGAGHYLPTTPTPAAWLELELRDQAGQAIAGASARQRIGRHIEYRDRRWVEIEDTRIPPGQSIELARGWRDGGVALATHVRVRVRVRPDDYYEGLYAARLTNPRLAAEAARLYRDALARARATAYVAYEEDWPIREESFGRGASAVDQ